MGTYTNRPQLHVASLAFNALPAIVTTAALILLMHSLIATNMSPPDIKPRQVFEYFTEVPEMSDPIPTDRTQRPPEVALPPSRVIPQFEFESEDVSTLGTGTSFVPVTTKGPISTGTNMVVPYLKLQPIYPGRALQRGIEGYVDLAFDITASGATGNIRVIDAAPRGVFERAAIKALERWKYKVPIVDGIPRGQVEMMTRLTFEIEE
ncbi:MAG: energy transducer TonB [Congregibacter sp.]